MASADGAVLPPPNALKNNANDELDQLLLSWGALLPSADCVAACENTPLAYMEHRELILPAYVALVVKSLRNISPHEQTIDLSCTLVVRIEFGKLPQTLQEELTRSLAFRFNESPLVYDSEHADTKWKGSLFVMTMRLSMQNVDFFSEEIDYSMWKDVCARHACALAVPALARVDCALPPRRTVTRALSQLSHKTASHTCMSLGSSPHVTANSFRLTSPG